MRVQLLVAGRLQEINHPQLVLVTKDDGTPFAVAADTGVPDTLCVATANDPEFNAILRNLGLDRAVLVQRLTLPPLTV